MAATLTLAVAPAAGAQTQQVADAVRATVAAPIATAVQAGDDAAGPVDIEPVPATAAPITVESGDAPAALREVGARADTCRGAGFVRNVDVARWYRRGHRRRRGHDRHRARPGPAGLGQGPQDLGDPDEPLGEPADPVPAEPDDGGVGLPRPSAPDEEAGGDDGTGGSAAPTGGDDDTDERPPTADDGTTDGSGAPAEGDDDTDERPPTADDETTDGSGAPAEGDDATGGSGEGDGSPDAGGAAPEATAAPSGGGAETLPFTGFGVGLLALLGALCLTSGLVGWRLAER